MGVIFILMLAFTGIGLANLLFLVVIALMLSFMFRGMR
jgi:hypothetical protein